MLHWQQSEMWIESQNWEQRCVGILRALGINNSVHCEQLLDEIATTPLNFSQSCDFRIHQGYQIKTIEVNWSKRDTEIHLLVCTCERAIKSTAKNEHPLIIYERDNKHLYQRDYSTT
jgi:hypothetical protein